MRGTIPQTQEPLQECTPNKEGSLTSVHFWVFGPQQYNRAYQIYSACIHSRQEESNISSDEPMRLRRKGWRVEWVNADRMEGQCCLI